MYSDIDECAERTHGCAHNCHNSIGNYSCSCNTGFQLNADGRGCSRAPEFIYPTLHQSICVAIPPNAAFITQLRSNSGDTNSSIVDIRIDAPNGTRKGDLSLINGTNIYYVNITWRPQDNQQNETYQFCFIAVNSKGLASEQHCIQLLAGHFPPTPIQATAIPQRQLVHPSNSTWHISFSMNIERPSMSAFITFHEFYSENVVYRIDASMSQEVTFVGSNFSVTPNYIFPEDNKYYINFERGVVQGLQGCGPASEPLKDKEYWTFEVMDVTPPSITLLESPSVSNANVTISWRSTENITWDCILVEDSTQMSVNCSEAYWTGYIINDGFYTLVVRGTDEAGNMATVTHEFRIDSTPPIATIVQKPSRLSDQRAPILTFRCNEACSFECKFFSNAMTQQVPFSCGVGSFAPQNLEHNGSYTFQVTAMDGVGNIGATVTYTWETDFESPLIYGSQNITAICTDTSPESVGQVQVVDDRPEVPSLTFRDVNNGCSIRRTWMATDEAGNSALFYQNINLEYSPTISFLSPIVFQCDSTLDTIEVPTTTASAPNPCRLPLLLTHEDSVSDFTCPRTFVRNWTVSVCNIIVSIPQTIVLNDLCPSYACGRNESTTRGICSFGNCQCNRPWYGEDCSELIYQPVVEPVNDSVIQEAQMYSTTITVIQGTEPLSWSLISGPDRLIVDSFSGQVNWIRAQAGNYTITVRIENQVGSIDVSWSLQVINGYNAFLNPVFPILYPRSQPIILSGHVEYIENSFVERFLARIVPVYIDVNTGGTTRTIRTFTSRNGSFFDIFFPAAAEYGSYIAGARHPDLSESPTQAQWGFQGMRATTNIISLRGEAVESFDSTFYNATVICNDGPATLEELTATPILSNDGYLGIEIALQGAPSNSTLEPGAKVLMDIQLTATRPLNGLFFIIMETSQGTRLQITVNVRIDPILPRLLVNPPSVHTRIIRGSSRVFEFNITNTGRTIARNIRSIIPSTNFISLISFGSSQLSEGNFSLESGQSAVLSILIQTPESQQLGEISSRIAIASNEVSVSIPIVLLVSSDVFMNLTVIVEDEYTYFASGQPLVNDATVTLINYQRNIRISQTTELDNGTVTFFNVFEDRYEMHVEAPDHISLRQVIITNIDDPIVTVFIQREAVRYTWTVTPVQVEDTYIVTVEADFETHVPIPVVTVTPTEIDLNELELGLVTSFQLNLTNHGLIRADNVGIQLPNNHPFLEFTTTNEDLGDLQALSSAIVLVQTSRRSVEKRQINFQTACNSYSIMIVYSYVCGTQQFRALQVSVRSLDVSRQQLQCTRPIRRIMFDPPDISVSPYTGEFIPIEVIPIYISITSFTARTPITCDACLHSILLSCATIPLSRILSCIPLLVSGDITDVLSWIQCLTDTFNPWLGYYLCLEGVFENCLRPLTESRNKRNLERAVVELMEALYPIHQSIGLGIEILGDEQWIFDVGDPAWLSDVLRPAIDDASELGTYISTTERLNILSAPPPNGTTTGNVARMLERLNNTLAGWNTGQLEPQDGVNMASYSAFQEFSRNIQAYNRLAMSKGFLSYLDAYTFARSDVIQSRDMGGEDGVCAVVRIRIEQELAITREAFLARLEIENQENSPLEQIVLEIIIADSETGEQATHLFSIGEETLSGSLSDTSDGWLLQSEMMGAAEWLIIPYSEAALENDRVYDVGGILRYSSDGSNITAPLLPAIITVRPDPSLRVHYFWERYVIGDDPFTDDVEPSVPFTLSVAVKNAGYGTAFSLRITSGQPEIIENERGLLVSFMIIGANIGNEAISPSLTVTFGDITPNTTKVARWLMISSLQGEFMNYSATFENINPLGDPRLSLLDELEIHELIRNVMIYSDPSENDGILDFLVNEWDDILAYPDALYSSKTLQSYNVSVGTVLSIRTISQSGRATLLEVTTSSNSTGWVYYRYEDTQGLLSATASAVNGTKYEPNEAATIPPENSWITRESSRGSRRATENFYLHIVDNVQTTDEVVFVMDLCMSNCSRPTTDSIITVTPTQQSTTVTASTGTTDIQTPSSMRPTTDSASPTLSMTMAPSTGTADTQTPSLIPTTDSTSPTTSTGSTAPASMVTITTPILSTMTDDAGSTRATTDSTTIATPTTMSASHGSTDIQTPSVRPTTDSDTPTRSTVMTDDTGTTDVQTPSSRPTTDSATTAKPTTIIPTTVTTDTPTTAGILL